MAEVSVAPRSGAARARRLSLWLLPLVLPVAFAVHLWEGAGSWWRAHELFAEHVPLGKSTPYAGADWRLDALTPLVERPDGSVLAVLDLSVRVAEGGTAAGQLCRIALADGTGRRWLPVPVLPSEIRRHPARRNHPGKPCNVAVGSGPAGGAELTVTETFQLPREALPQLVVQLSLETARPHYLEFATR